MARDATDQIIEQWAKIRREVIGIRHPLKTTDYLGAPRCTLSSRRDLHAGASSSGRVEQHFPEVYTGTAALVNWLFWQSKPWMKETFDWHWTLEKPRDKRVRADLMGLSPDTYWKRVARVKCYVEGGLALAESVRTVSPPNGVIFRMSVSVGEPGTTIP